MGKYKITKEHCEKMIADNGNVCQQCGGELSAFDTVDNAGDPTFWSGCKACCIYTGGVKPEVQKIAKMLILHGNETYYSHLNKYEYEKNGDIKYWQDAQTGGMAGLVSKVLRLYKKMNSEQADNINKLGGNQTTKA